MPDVAELQVDGVRYGGWKSIRISRGIEQIAGAFELGLTERWAGQDLPRPIRPGDECEVMVDGETVITGYVDDARPSYDKESHAVTVSGRDRTGDLVDCSAIHKSGQWANARLDKIARDLCAPFGIKVHAEVEVGRAFGSFSLNEGEAVFECLDRAARLRAVLLVSDGRGGLVIARAGATRAPAQLVEGENILAASGDFSWRERYSRITVKGQGRGDDENNGATVAHVAARVDDASITRYRPLIVLAEDQDRAGTLKDRAEWEMGVRMGRGSRASVTVQGWHADASTLWQPNRLVHLRSPYLGADIDLLIVSATYILDESGTRTEMELVRPEAFDLIGGVKSSRLDAAIKRKKASSPRNKTDGFAVIG